MLIDRESMTRTRSGGVQMKFERGLMILLIAAACLASAFLLYFNQAEFITYGLSAIVALFFAVRLSKSVLYKKGDEPATPAGNAGRGERVEQLLAALPHGYQSFHGLSFRGVDVEHVVVGLGGIFVIETKDHDGTVDSADGMLLIDGRAPGQDFISNTWSRVSHVRDFLKERTGREWPVKPLLCFTDAAVLVRGTVNGVAVVDGNDLARHISWQKYLLSAEEVAQAGDNLEEIAGDADLWVKKMGP